VNYNWLENRYEFKKGIEFFSKKSIPVSKDTIIYFFGSALVFFFMVQVFTGVLLMVYYLPYAREAFDSVQLISDQVSFGWLIRSFHVWSSHLIVLFLIFHMATVFFKRCYRFPRELTWIIGMGLLLLILFLCFTGNILPLNQKAFYAFTVGSGLIEKFPFVGSFIFDIMYLKNIFISLTRLFTLHTIVLPFLIFIFLSLHIVLVRVQGIKINEDANSNKKTIPFYPDFLKFIFLSWIILANILLLLSVFFPPELGRKASGLVLNENIIPEWYFLPIFQLIKVFPSAILGLSGDKLLLSFFTLIFLIIFLLPFWDKSSEKTTGFKIITALGVLTLVFFIGLTAWGFIESFS